MKNNKFCARSFTCVQYLGWNGPSSQKIVRQTWFLKHSKKKNFEFKSAVLQLRIDFVCRGVRYIHSKDT